MGAAGARRRLAVDPLAAAGERGLARPQHRRGAQRRSATPTTRTGWRSTRRPAKELRLFGLAGWAVDRFIDRRTPALRAAVRGDAAARASGRSGACCSSLGANVVVFWSLATRPPTGRSRLGPSSSSSRRSPSASALIAFGGLNWALDGAAAPVAAVLRLEPRWRRRARSTSGRTAAADGLPAREIRVPRRAFALPARAARPVLDGLRPDDPGGVVAGDRRPERRRQDDAGQAAVPALRPARAARSRSTASTCATSTSTPGARGSPRCSRTSSASSCRCATTSRPAARPTTTIRAALADAGADGSGRARHPAGQAATPAASTSPAASGSASRWPARCARCDAAPAWCCSTSRPRSSTCAARPRSSTACSRATRDVHDDPDLAPLLDRAARRPHLRARARPGRRAGHATTS